MRAAGRESPTGCDLALQDAPSSGVRAFGWSRERLRLTSLNPPSTSPWHLLPLLPPNKSLTPSSGNKSLAPSSLASSLAVLRATSPWHLLPSSFATRMSSSRRCMTSPAPRAELGRADRDGSFSARLVGRESQTSRAPVAPRGTAGPGQEAQATPSGLLRERGSPPPPRASESRRSLVFQLEHATRHHDPAAARGFNEYLAPLLWSDRKEFL